MEQLLQAAQDNVLLKLSLDFHIARYASHSLDTATSKLSNLLAPLHPSRDQNPHLLYLKLTTTS
ncbi:hypothetical protein CDL15_Pgr023531 [Punica granatum]|uniref:Uncharacterized protein n=1 Tax=Punica granatum TaxID=22663 RepID=A0A218W7F7_PUNGR|nr:hypothetical protein CDL15_Pgr023531 [Punica granatum]